MKQEFKLLADAIKAIEALQNHSTFKNREIERQINWTELTKTLAMLKDAELNSKPL